MNCGEGICLNAVRDSIAFRCCDCEFLFCYLHLHLSSEVVDRKLRQKLRCHDCLEGLLDQQNAVL